MLRNTGDRNSFDFNPLYEALAFAAHADGLDDRVFRASPFQSSIRGFSFCGGGGSFFSLGALGYFNPLYEALAFAATQ